MERSEKPEMLLHICCAPDATYVIQNLSKDYLLTGYFYNPNIHPEEEYLHRLEEMRSLSRKLDLKLFWGDYDVDRWFALTEGLEDEPEGGVRCEVCFRMRLEKMAQFAKERDIDNFTTVLTVSPHKSADVINRIGREIAQEYKVCFLAADFKKRNGFKKSVELSRKYGLYRQNYCGCVYSRREK